MPVSDELPYQREFLAGFEKRCCYDRFWYQSGESAESSSRIMNCGYSFTWVGSAKDAGYFMNDRNGAVATFRHIYVPMGVIAHFHRAALLAASAQLSALSELHDVDKQQEHQKRLQKLYQRFITFTQVFWFDEISPQEQGRELFAGWRHELRTQELFNEVRQELRDMTDLQNAQEQVKQAREAQKLTKIALPFAAISVFVGYVSMLASGFGMNTISSEKDTWIPVWKAWIHWPMAALASILTIVIPVAIVWLYLELRTKKPGKHVSVSTFNDQRVSRNS